MFKQNVTVFVGISGATVETPQIFNYFCFQISPYPKTLVLFPSLFSPKFPQIKNLSLLPSTRQTFPKSAASSHSWTVAGLYRHTPQPSEKSVRLFYSSIFLMFFPLTLVFVSFWFLLIARQIRLGLCRLKCFIWDGLFFLFSFLFCR